jgi:Domain of unknown function (DUF4350)
MKSPNRLTIFTGIAIAVLILLTLIAAPGSGKLNNGSTYNRAPEGYGAWYSYMQRRGAKIERWQRPLLNIESQKDLTTLLRVNPSPRISSSEYELQNWLEQGNTLVILGVSASSTAAEFSTIHKSTAGNVKIDTTKRYSGLPTSKGKSKQKISEPIEPKPEILLKDSFGAIIWQKSYGKGKVIYSVTPHLAANAYQNERGNFEYLAQLVSNSSKNKKIYIDEYIHGYKDKDIREAKGEGSIQRYFMQKPIFAAVVQAGVLLVVLVISQNRRFGKRSVLEAPTVDNSQAYIQALAAVLQKADSTDFVVEMVGKQELLQLQRSLGLGKNNIIDATPLLPNELLNAWQNKVGASDLTDLKVALQIQSQKRRLSEKDLIAWLKKWESIRQTPNS